MSRVFCANSSELSMLITLRAPALATISVETPEPSSTTKRGLRVRAMSAIVSNKSGDAAQLRVGGIGAENLSSAKSCCSASPWRYECQICSLISFSDSWLC